MLKKESVNIFYHIFLAVSGSHTELHSYEQTQVVLKGEMQLCSYWIQK